MDEVDLETDVELDLVRVVAGDRDNADEIEEWDTALSIVHEVDLALFICCEAFLHMGDSCLVCERSGRALFDSTIRCLEEAAVSSDDLGRLVTCQLEEGGRSIDDWMVVSTDVNNNEAAGEIDGTECDCWVWARGYSSENAEHVESGSGVKWRGVRTCRF